MCKVWSSCCCCSMCTLSAWHYRYFASTEISSNRAETGWEWNTLIAAHNTLSNHQKNLANKMHCLLCAWNVFQMRMKCQKMMSFKKDFMCFKKSRLGAQTHFASSWFISALTKKDAYVCDNKISCINGIFICVTKHMGCVHISKLFSQCVHRKAAMQLQI